MPISIDDLCRRIRPAKTSLLLGAGASVPSGAPSGAQLSALLWKTVAKEEPRSEDLVETASILVRKYSRRPVAEAVVDHLKGLRPTGGLLGLPEFGWRQLFTTNFDRLVEDAYKTKGLPLVTIRSNYDFSSAETLDGIRLLKMHGCITQDESFGDKASMILTDDDFAKFRVYRQAMFASPEVAMLQGDIIVLGQSLRDRHLSDLVKEVLSAKKEGSPGHVYMLVYEPDDLRAPLFEDRGVRIAFGGIDNFVHGLSQEHTAAVAAAAPVPTGQLPLRLVSTVREVGVEVTKPASVVRMFNGASATYADIEAQATFERSQHSSALTSLDDANTISLAIVGSAGVGKTTFARQLVLELARRGVLAWEHRSDFPFQPSQWRGLEAQLRASGERAVLMVDECTHYMRSVNALADYLAGIDAPSLKLVLTANYAQWAPRMKSPKLFSRGKVIEISRLEDVEINSLLNLVEHNNSISNLVHANFKNIDRSSQYRQLRQKCDAEMYVCLKNIFANENLDTILLQEFDELAETLQDYYRYVAALEAVGTKVHRQQIIRMRAISPQAVEAILSGLSGIVDEYDIVEDDGVFGWSTRHLVIARKITEYKFSSLDDLYQLFSDIVENINPSVPIELQTVRDICDVQFGIGRLASTELRQTLYRKLIALAPGERIPWHRLIREQLREGALEDTEYVIRDAERAVGRDAPIDRYRVRLLIRRADTTPRISDDDRRALLRKAYESAMRNVDYYHWDKFSYITLCDAAVALVERGDSPYVLDEAIAKMREAVERILDPDMRKRLREYEDVRRRLH